MGDFVVGSDGKQKPASSLLDQFKEDMAAELPDIDVLVQHKYRPGYAMRFHTDLPTRLLTKWQRACVTNQKRGEIDSLRLSSIILGHLCTSITRDGEELVDPAGAPVTFGSRFFMDSMGQSDSVEAIRAFMVRDGFVIAVAEELLRQCGYDDEVSPDPMNAS